MTATDVLLDRETANDETAVVVAVFVASGTRVEKDEPLFDIENSKATQEVAAPEAGILVHNLAVGQTVEFGVPIARIEPAAGAAPAAVPSHAAVAEPPAPTTAVAPPAPQAPVAVIPVAPPRSPGKRHVSQAAAALMAELGLKSAAFAADFITVRDVRAAAGLAPVQAKAAPSPAATPSPAPRFIGAETPQVRAGQAVTARKRAEIDALSNGAGGTMLSVLGASLGPMAVPRPADDFLGSAITDLVIYEAARLMRKYPSLNAFYEDGRIVRHDAVHAGLAIDGGGQLVVYGIADADRLGLPEVAQAIGDAVGRYVDGALTGAELTRATFTVTDLSAEPLDFVLPLLPRGQSCILGVTRDEGGFRIFAGFDHRVTEGREVAAFLGDLRRRLLSFVSPRAASVIVSGVAPEAVPRPGPLAAPAAECAYCARSAAEATERGQAKGLLKLVDRGGRDILCCASCWNGW